MLLRQTSKRSCLLILFVCFNIFNLCSSIEEDGSKLWFTNYQKPIINYNYHPNSIYINEFSPTFQLILDELKHSMSVLFAQNIQAINNHAEGSICVGTSNNRYIAESIEKDLFRKIGNEGFIIKYISEEDITIIAANTDIAALYGTHHFLRLLRTDPHLIITQTIIEKPAYQNRILNHWDNLDGTVERGYAGHSIWKWEDLPERLNSKIKDYARANSSIGINGTVLNNVNADPEILQPGYLRKVKRIADELRPYGIRVYLSVNFSSPEILSGLPDSDPFNPNVKEWWFKKVNSIYEMIPDFGGFLVKANSEGQPGPQDYGRTHADGANMLAHILKPFGGIVMWRAFVYNPSGEDRAKQAFNEFKPLDGEFLDNVLIQVKNGPIDFQPREPFNPLFGAMDNTALMPEVQITKEYLGFSDHLAYLGPLFSEFLQSDTYAKGKNSTVARITDNSIYGDKITAIAGVANIGSDTNWCGHHFDQANWYVFGRLSWNHQLSVKEVALEWLKQTFTIEPGFVETMARVMMESRETVVNYMTPLGLHHLMGWSHHYGPEPWCDIPGARPDWLPKYYHNADSNGIGFDRSSSGSDAVDLYAEPLRSIFNDPRLCPEKYLLWFHHLPWDYQMSNGRDLWTELCHRYSEGVENVRLFRDLWHKMEDFVDPRRYNEVRQKMDKQLNEAIWWRDACLLYFQTFSGREIPQELEQPIHNLNELMQRKFDLKHHN